MQQIISKSPLEVKVHAKSPTEGVSPIHVAGDSLFLRGFLEQDDGRNWYNIFPMMGKIGIKVSHFLEFHAFNVFLFVFCFF